MFRSKLASENPGNLVAMKEELIKKALPEAMKAHEKSSEKFLEKAADSEVIFSFPGSGSVKDWFCQNTQGPFGEKKINLKLFPSIGSIGNEEVADVNQAFEERFQSILENSELKDKVCCSDFLVNFWYSVQISESLPEKSFNSIWSKSSMI